MKPPTAKPWFLAAALALGAIQLACCESESDYSYSYNFNNYTPFFLHVLVPDANHLWVPPDAQLSLGTDSPSLTVLIAPGQHAEGRYSTEMVCCEDRCGAVSVRRPPHGDDLDVTYNPPSCGSSGSCPYVYVATAAGFTRVGEALTGALNRGARREDRVPLGPLAAIDGRYRVRLAAELLEDDSFDSVALDLVDHDPALEIVAGPDETLLAVRAPLAPLAVLDAAGRDRLPPLLADDGDGWEGTDVSSVLDGRVRDWVTVEFPRPAGAGDVVLLVRGNNTAFLQDSYHAYIRQFGPGLPKLMRGTSAFPAYRPIVEGLLRSAGFAMDVAVEDLPDWKPLGTLPAVGPAGPRTVALRLSLPPSDAPTFRVRLAVLPGAWRVEQVRLASPVDADLAVRSLSPSGSMIDAPNATIRDVAPDPLAAIDGRTLDVPYRHGLTVLFDAPAPAPALSRSAFLRVEGWYEERDASPLPCIRWRNLFSAALGQDSFATFVLERLRKQEALRLLAGLGADTP
ncbi:MAG: hypothetical protein HY907_15130 [Deltaproteobacteria bacterium]|nr:hypothetical protein [Deltaproteobacteria bacterium]